MNTQPIPIETSRVQIRRTAISIQALKIDNRQMTQSIFRQLPVIDWTGAVGMTPWGWLNYWPATETGAWRCRPAVFESGGTLRRSPIPETKRETTDRLRANWECALSDAENEVRKKYPRARISIHGHRIVTAHGGWEDGDPDEVALRAELEAVALRIFADFEKVDAPLLDALDRANRLLDELGQLFIAA